MKIYFAMTVLGDRRHADELRGLVEFLVRRGHEILTEHLFRADAWERDRELTAREVFERDLVWLAEADVIVVDATGSSFGIGFETGYALGAMDKPLYLLYDRRREERISRMAVGLTHPNARIVPYEDVAEAREFLDRALSDPSRLSRR